MLSDRKTFNDLKPRQTITFLIPNGIGRNGAEFKEKTGKIVMAFDTHVVVDGGGGHGTPHVVNEKNFVRKGK